MPRIGLDFDNTLVCYDHVFHRAAVEKGWIATSIAVNKNAVRDQLRAQGGEEDWIALQGEVYGMRMQQAQPFPGAVEFVRAANALDCEVFIVSHKTSHPFKGPHWDLHEAARDWIQKYLSESGIVSQNVYFELTKEAKLARIASCACTHFVDDLPEILTASEFPRETRAFLFDPVDRFAQHPRYTKVRTWESVGQVFESAGATL